MQVPNKAILGASLNKRKNIFENGRNQSQPTTTKQVAVGGISNRKELYLKQAEDKKENKVNFIFNYLTGILFLQLLTAFLFTELAK